eukprot:TRINITY_DN557_c0_g1_i1.p1 TRINITY_DN557_c0_g1~~TRINITY_DN557_c0_g1_i1.p1  ORF type:complete len:695 (-),score=102.65 TRINITY_DN557_c0_g1_i1:50-2134(-)
MGELRYSQFYLKHCQHLLQNLKIILRDDAMLDATIVCANGDRLRTSCTLLSAVSPLFRQTLDQHPDMGEEKCLILPDVPAHYVICFLNKLLQWRAMPSKMDWLMMHTVLEALGSNQPYSLDKHLIITDTQHLEQKSLPVQTTQAATTRNDDNLAVDKSEPTSSGGKRKVASVKTIYRCDKCMKQFRIKRDFLNHINSHLGIKPFSCTLCQKSFTQKSHLNTHVDIHLGLKKHVCYKCGRSFNVKSNLKKHLAVHFRDQEEAEFEDVVIERTAVISSDDVVVADNQGSKDFGSEKGELSSYSIATEIQNHPSTNQQEQHDALPNQSISTESLQHSRVDESAQIFLIENEQEGRIRHPGDTESVSDRNEADANILVNVVSKTDESGISLYQRQPDNRIQVQEFQPVVQEHLYVKRIPPSETDGQSTQHHAAASQNYELYTTTNLSSIGSHKDGGAAVVSVENYCQQVEIPPPQEVAVASKAFSCNFCDKSFKQKSHLNHHIKVKHLKGEHLEKYSCKICEHKFTSTNSLKHHMMLHNNQRPHQCPHCNKKFVQASHLKMHMTRHFGDKPFLCVVCGKSFAAKSRLVEHTKIHTGERRVYECGQCTAKYFGLHDLKIHERKHTGELPYKCGHCPKQFRSHRNRDNHQRIHTGEKPYLCQGCGKGYGSGSSLHQHYAKSDQCKAVAAQFQSGLYTMQQ